MNHLTDEQLEHYRQRRMAPEELIAADDHISGCESCRGQMSKLENPGKEVIAQFSKSVIESDAFEHLPYELLAGYVDTTLDEVDLEIVEGHLDICSQCAAEMEDLRAFRATLTTYPAKEYAPLAPEPIVNRILSSFSRSRAWLAPLSAVTVAALLVISITRSRGKQALTLTDSGIVISMDSAGIISGLDDMSPDDQQAVRIALRSQQIETPSSLAGLPTGKVRGGSSFRLLSPVATVVKDERPTLRWEDIPDKTSYHVVIYDKDGREIARSENNKQTQWTVDSPLQRGATYSWEVIATLSDGTKVSSSVNGISSRPRFKILEADSANGLEISLRRYHKSHLMSGLLFARYGVLDEAEHEFELLDRDNRDSAIAHKLLESVRSTRRSK